ncbi:ACP S-malonyltransferase [Miltoncostaea oceani]|uniref:ACP S-malonyltransferase n=1 Tax=Miltoncostaea oceani TaxID=2843216 RepID=UPI001C3D93ED|nr:ACP S-malonyltransferase [Miltoncostaea oceani]
MIVAMFPGQGAQAVGMGEGLAREHEVARRVFEEADDVLGWSVSELCFTGPIERLTATDVCQPALLTASVAAFRVAVEAGLAPALVMGHSLGEYSALVAAGSLPFADGLRLVAERGSAMRAAAQVSPGAMAALLGPSDDDARALAAEAGEAWPANYNCPGQVVVSGSDAAIDRLMELASERGVRAARLVVDGPFHSPLVAPAAERLRPALEAWDPAPPTPPFLSTTTCDVEPPERLRAVLLDQLTSPVRFGDAVTAAIALGATRMVEVGPGRVLSGLVKRVRRDLPTQQIGEPADVAAIGASA